MSPCTANRQVSENETPGWSATRNACPTARSISIRPAKVNRASIVLKCEYTAPTRRAESK